MNQNHSSAFNTRRVARCALVAAVYVALCLGLAPFSFGAVQIRVAEILTLMPIFGPEYIAAVSVGCFLSNLLGVSMGMTAAPDILFGTLATVLACLVTYRLRGLRPAGLALPAAVPPVLFNALIVGWEISVFFSDTPATLPVTLFNMLTVGVGEVISCCVLGVALVKLIERNRALRRIFAA